MKDNPAFKGEIVKAVINCALIPLCFIKIFCEIAVLPGIEENGEPITTRNYYYQSIFDRLSREGMEYLLWISVALIGLSIILCLLNTVVRGNKILKISSNAIFGISIAYFLILLFLSFCMMHTY